jgi:hypothetical protein
MGIRRLIAAGAATLVLVAGVACGDGGGPAAPTAIVPDGEPSRPAANVTPFPTPFITGSTVRSPSKGYAATFPEGWRVRPNIIQTADASVDSFFEPLVEGAKVQANIAVNCIVLKASSPAQRIEFEKTMTVRRGTNKDIVVSERQVAGLTATVLGYRFESANTTTPDLDKQDIFFSSDKCDWTITTTAAAGEYGKYQQQFDAFINSFDLLD